MFKENKETTPYLLHAVRRLPADASVELYDLAQLAAKDLYNLVPQEIDR